MAAPSVTAQDNQFYTPRGAYAPVASNSFEFGRPEPFTRNEVPRLASGDDAQQHPRAPMRRDPADTDIVAN